jgi:hypothetical protein
LPEGYKDAPILFDSRSFLQNLGDAKFFYIINHTIVETPVDNTQIFDNTGALTSGAGAIDSLATSARQIQLGLKIIW